MLFSMNRHGVWLLIFMTGLALASLSSSSMAAQDNTNANASLVVRGGEIITVDDSPTVRQIPLARGSRPLPTAPTPPRPDLTTSQYLL